MRRLLLVPLLLLAACGPDNPSPEHFTLTSDALGTDYEVRVYASEQLDLTAGPLPWILVLDGQYLYSERDIAERLMDRGEAAPHLVVGIGNDDTRDRDYTPTEDEVGTGGWADFFAFVESEVIPWVETEYPVGGTPELRALTGHSYGGLATVTSMFRQQDLFGCFGATSPSLFWDEGEPFAMESDYAANNDDLAARVYLSMGALEQTPMNALFNTFVDRLDGRAYPGLELKSKVWYGHEHYSSVAPAYAEVTAHCFPLEGSP